VLAIGAREAKVARRVLETMPPHVERRGAEATDRMLRIDDFAPGDAPAQERFRSFAGIEDVRLQPRLGVVAAQAQAHAQPRGALTKKGRSKAKMLWFSSTSGS